MKIIKKAIIKDIRRATGENFIKVFIVSQGSEDNCETIAYRNDAERKEAVKKALQTASNIEHMQDLKKETVIYRTQENDELDGVFENIVSICEEYNRKILNK